MKVGKIGTTTPTFKKMVIVKPENWPAEVLDNFIKNKEVQELTKDFAAENRDLTACCICSERRGLVTIFKNLALFHEIEADSIQNLQKKVTDFTRKNIKFPFLSKEEQERLDSAKKYVDEFNKTLEPNTNKPLHLEQEEIKPPKEQSFRKRLFKKLAGQK